ncbi:hypothetical protein [Streptomyces ardesiacus]|uniref:hypothetical protein n=1 Tax=Streptomyces ardesiacus TaxID=285564 RepID=UPI0037FB50FE
MSLMKMFALDLHEMAEKAAGAAQLDTAPERMAALTTVFRECGERGHLYYDSQFATRQLVRECVREFQTERAEARKELANA